MTDLIILRELNMGDVHQLYAIYSDKEAMKYRGSKPMETIEDAKDYVRNKEVKEKEVTTIRKGVELTKTKELIGSVMYRFSEKSTHEYEIGYSIGRQFWGQGLGKEIVKTMLKAIEAKNEIKDIVAWCNKENIASIKILEDVGFRRVHRIDHLNSYLYIKAKSKSRQKELNQ
ncbi:MAG: GNAT family N-acetyltransferase [Bacteroidota bacterium]